MDRGKLNPLRESPHILNIKPDSGGGGNRKSLRRSWNQLSRLQRNILFTVLVGVSLTCIFYINTGNNRSSISGNVPPDSIANAAPNDKIISNKLTDGNDDDSEKRFEKDPESEHDRELKVEEPEVESPQLNVGAVPPQVVEPQSEEAEEEKRMIESNDLMEAQQQMPARQQQQPPPLPSPRKPIKPMHFKGPMNERQQAVVESLKHAWKGYKLHAWGHDNLKPISGGYSDWFGLGLTLIDSLDTLYMMGLHEEFKEARDWVETELSFNKNQEVNLFETTIRVLGGLLSAYHLSADEMFLDKAKDLGDRLMPAFKTPSGIPFSDTNLLTLKSHAPRWSPDSSTSEVTTIQLEFRDLARCTGESRFEEAIQSVNEKVHALPKKDGLVPIFINANTGTFRVGATISLGARGDSYYEYLLKQYLQTGKKGNDFLIEDYVAAIEGVHTHLLKTTPNDRLVYVGELLNGKEFKPKMDHLTCYLSGTLLLGHQHAQMPDTHLQLAKDLLETCYQTYMRQPTNLAPEITYFNLNAAPDIYVKSNDAHNLLRPEFVESLYYFYALTGNTSYQDMGWTIFQAFEAHTKVPTGGYTSIGNVKSVLNKRPRDMMESFFLGETLKYFYLLFSGDRKEVDLEKWIFNTEAHLIPVLENDKVV